MALGGRPEALRISLIDVAAYPRVDISLSVASRISSREFSPCSCFLVRGAVTVGLLQSSGDLFICRREHAIGIGLRYAEFLSRCLGGRHFLFCKDRYRQE